MKILILTDEVPADISNVNVDIIVNANYLSNKGHEVFLASHSGKKITNENFNHLPMGVDTFLDKESPVSFLVRNITFFKSTLEKIKSITPNIILCIGGGQMLMNFVIGLFLSRFWDIPIIAEWRGSELLLKDSTYRKTIKRFVLGNSSINILRSVHMKEMALDIEPKAEIYLSPSKGVNMEKFTPRENSNNAKEKKIRLLYVGRLHEVKDISSLLQAFNLVKRTHPDLHMTIIGKGSSRDILLNEVEKLGVSNEVEFVGEIDHDMLPSYYRRSDIFVLPSLSEGLSNVLMEAMACGLPVVATDVGGNQELVEHDQGGYLVKPKSSEELAAAVTNLVEDPDLREKMGKFNRKYIEKFEQETVLRRRAKILEEVAEAR